MSRSAVIGGALACVFAGVLSPAHLAAQTTEEPGQESQERDGGVGVITGYFGILAPLAHLTTNPETFDTDISISIAVGGEFDYFFPSGLGFGVLGLYAPADLTISPSGSPIAVPPDLGSAKWLTVTGNLMYRVDLKGPADLVEPYVLVGGGIRNLNVDPIAAPEATDSTDGVVSFGGGAFVLVTRQFAFRIDLRGYISPFTAATEVNTRTQFDLTTLIGFSFGFP